MNYPTTFSKDMQELAKFYGWNDDDKKEVRAAFTDCEPMVRYFTILAAAHRAGYEQHAGNGFIRLQNWCAENGLEDPFSVEFDPAALDAIANPKVAA